MVMIETVAVLAAGGLVAAVMQSHVDAAAGRER